MDEYTKLLYGLAGIGITSYVGYTAGSISKLKREIDALRLEVYKTFAQQGVMQEFKEDLNKLTAVVYEIAGKMGIPIRRD